MRSSVDTPLLTLESDKAAMDVPSTVSGVVEKVHTSKGGKVNAGDVIVTVKAEGGAGAAVAPAAAARQPATSSTPSRASDAAGAQARARSSRSG